MREERTCHQHWLDRCALEGGWIPMELSEQGRPSEKARAAQERRKRGCTGLILRGAAVRRQPRTRTYAVS